MSNLLTPRELAEAIGVSESSVKRWVDDGRIRAARTAGGHRRIPVREAMRFVRESDAVLVRPEILGFDELRAAERDRSSADEARCLHACLQEGAVPETLGLVTSLYLEGWSVASIVDGPLRQALERLGRLWRDDETGIFFEHRAVDLAVRALNRLREVLPEPEEDAPPALGGAPSGDPYMLPSLAAAAVLQAEGFGATNLGPETPPETLRLAAERVRPRLVWLSVSVAEDPAALSAGIAGLLGAEDRDGPLVVLGGRSAARLRLPLHPRLHRGATMAELAALAKGLRRAARRPA